MAGLAVVTSAAPKPADGRATGRLGTNSETSFAPVGCRHWWFRASPPHEEKGGHQAPQGDLDMFALLSTPAGEPGTDSGVSTVGVLAFTNVHASIVTVHTWAGSASSATICSPHGALKHPPRTASR